MFCTRGQRDRAQTRLTSGHGQPGVVEVVRPLFAFYGPVRFQLPSMTLPAE
jgi:hypothetical protein